MQRSIGRMVQKSPGDNAKTAVLLKDYDDAEQLLTRLAEQVSSWRAAWMALAHAQLGIVTELESLYDPIVGAADDTAKPHNPTPELLLERTLSLREAYNELKTDLLEEIEVVNEKVVKPVSEARDYVVPVRKTIKKREKLRLDYENVQTDLTKLQRKPSRTPKDDKSLAKLEAELGPKSDAFHDVDTILKEVLPPMIAAAFGILPPVLATLVEIQNRLLGLYYTTLHTYCENFHFPLPPPGMDNVVEMWTSDHEPIRSQIEALGCVVAGRRFRMTAGADPKALPASSRRPLAPAYGPSSDESNIGRRTSSTSLISSNNTTAPQPRRIPSASSIGPGPDISTRPSFTQGMATDFTTASRLGQAAAAGSPSSLAPSSAATARTASYGGDYFGRTQSSISTAGHNSSITSPSSPVTTAVTAAAAAKKKPPPPPPPAKPRAPLPPAEYVVALYDYASQGSGDLSFREGDRIKILKKTATDQDWWEGEVGGVKGSFPANYCRPE